MTDRDDMIANRQNILSEVKPDKHAEAMPYILQTQGPIPGVDEASSFKPMTSMLLEQMGGAGVNTAMKEAQAALAAGENLPDGIPSGDVNLAAGTARSARARWDLARQQGMSTDALSTLESTAVRERARAHADIDRLVDADTSLTPMERKLAKAKRHEAIEALLDTEDAKRRADAYGQYARGLAELDSIATEAEEAADLQMRKAVLTHERDQMRRDLEQRAADEREVARPRPGQIVQTAAQQRLARRSNASHMTLGLLQDNLVKVEERLAELDAERRSRQNATPVHAWTE